MENPYDTLIRTMIITVWCQVIFCIIYELFNENDHNISV